MSHPKGNKTIGQTSSHTDVAETIGGPIVVGNLASVTILDREIVPEGVAPHRMQIVISVRLQPAWIKLQAASIDNDQKGIFIPRDGSLIIDVEAMYFGEISAIAALAAVSNIYITVL